MVQHRDVTELKIVHIMDLMREFQWSGKVRKALASEWSVTEEWVTDLATVASKRVLAEVTDKSAVKCDAGMAMRKILHEGVTSTDPRARRNAIEAAKTWAALAGANEAAKVEAAITEVVATTEHARQLMKETFHSDVGDGLAKPDADPVADPKPA